MRIPDSMDWLSQEVKRFFQIHFHLHLCKERGNPKQPCNNVHIKPLFLQRALYMLGGVWGAGNGCNSSPNCQNCATGLLSGNKIQGIADKVVFQDDPSQKLLFLRKHQKRGAWKRIKKAEKGEKKKHFIDQYPCRRRIFSPVLSGTDSFGGDIFRIRYMNFWLP